MNLFSALRNKILMKKSTILKIIGLIIGTLCLCYWLWRLDLPLILNNILELKWWILPLLINSLAWILCYTAAWKIYFSNLVHQISFLHLLRIKICGDAVNYLTPLGFVAGDPVRVLMLERHMGGATRLGSVVVDRLIHSLATVSFVLMGVLLAAFLIPDMPLVLRWGLPVFYTGFAVVLVLFIVDIVQGKGVRRFHAIISKFSKKQFLIKLEEWIVKLHDELSGFGEGGLGPLVHSFLYHFCGRLLGALEISIIFLYLDGSPHFVFSIILATLTTVVHFVFSFIPAGLGVVESLYAGLFYLNGLDPTVGVSMQLIRRLRSFLWVAIGSIVFSFRQDSKNS